MKISIFASAIRTKFWPEQLESLEKNKVDWELVYVGSKQPDFHHPNLKWYFSEVKPAQCCEAARRNCTGDILSWTADDAIYPAGILDDIANLFTSYPDEKLIIAAETIENERPCPWESFLLFDNNPLSPIMAPFGFIRKAWFDKLGGFDKRYIGGQYENDLLLRHYAAGGQIMGYDDKPIIVDHYNKHTNHHSDFSNFYKHGRKVLEDTWRLGGYQEHSADGQVLHTPAIEFQPYSDKEILTKTQGPQGLWE
jgi:hypothetical protein